MSLGSVQPLVADAAERVRALDPTESFLVQAPAGSGKTELLVLRYLSLLPTVEEPEQVLAITFTRKATAEMRVRVLQALESTSRGDDTSASDHERNVRRYAQAALAHAEARGWQLLAQPQRLNIQTIDSLALSIAYRMPLLSRLGGQLTPVDEAAPFYAIAAERVLAHLGSAEEPELAGALERILRLRDASLPDCESLIAGMLERRDQWMLVLPGIARRDPDWESLRAKLEEPFHREHTGLIATLHRSFARWPEVLPGLLTLAPIACECGIEELNVLRDVETIEALTDATHWQSLCHLLLTKGSDWRKRSAIPAKTYPEQAMQLRSLMETLSDNDSLLDLLCRVRELPPIQYSEQEWTIVRSIFTVLRRAVAELRVVFAEQGVIDFVEAGLGAHAALQDPGLLMQQDERLRHILVDEFQDTSRAHFALLRTLLQDWQPGGSRTCFFVGDPMQSIYLFRGAESTLFDQVRSDGLELDGMHHPLALLQLSTNFRSTAAIVQPLNDVFTRVLTHRGEGGIAYAPSLSSKTASGLDAVFIHPQICEQGDLRTSNEHNGTEAEAALAIIRSHLPAIEHAKQNGTKHRVAVLARSRLHLVDILDRLRQEKIPFRGVKIDLLRDRPEILDILSLLRALLHPADRIAWLAILRAPWCGLPIPAMHAICGDPSDAERFLSIPELLRLHADELDAESRRRGLHVLSILEHAQDAYAQGSLASSPASLALWLERTWYALGAQHVLNAEAMANADVFFATLATMPPNCFGVLDETLNKKLEKLYAQPDPATSENYGVQLMTIHSAKGLEFEAVLVPQLHRPGKPDDAPLFHWLLRRREHTPDDELLLAPIGRKHGDSPPLYKWVGKKSVRLQRLEEKRLLYVACSRAIHELHLFATLERNQDGSLSMPTTGSLLSAGWDGLQSRFEQTRQSLPPASNLSTMPSPQKTPMQGVLTQIAATATPSQTLRRLPSDWFANTAQASHPGRSQPATAVEFHSPVGSRVARVQGIVLHTLMEYAARHNGEVAGTDLVWERLADGLLRQHALAPADAASARAVILRSIRQALKHDEGRWLLGARGSAQNEQSQNETSWSSLPGGRMQRQRPDRVFLAGERPGVPGSQYVWIVDYKTAAPSDDMDRERFVASSRDQYRKQLESYSELFRKLDEQAGLRAHRKHRLALYYPALPWLDWWPME